MIIYIYLKLLEYRTRIADFRFTKNKVIIYILKIIIILVFNFWNHKSLIDIRYSVYKKIIRLIRNDECIFFHSSCSCGDFNDHGHFRKECHSFAAFPDSVSISCFCDLLFAQCPIYSCPWGNNLCRCHNGSFHLRHNDA